MPRNPKDVKTADQLVHEIAYYTQQLDRTQSRGRMKRAVCAIETRQKLLEEIRKREAVGNG